jgi:hypothetical protein
MTTASFAKIADNNRKVRCTVCGQPCTSHLECDRNVQAAKKVKKTSKTFLRATDGTVYTFSATEGADKVHISEDKDGYWLGGGFYRPEVARKRFADLRASGATVVAAK